MNASAERRWKRAMDYLRQGQVAAARVQLEALRSLAPGDLRTHLLAARIAWREGHPGDAALLATDAAHAATDELDLLCELVDTLLLVGESAAAHSLLARPIWQQIESAESLLRYADFRRQLGEHAQSLLAFDQLIAKRVDIGAWRCYRGQQLEFLGRLDEAALEYEACLSLTPDNGSAAYYLSRLHRGKHNTRYLEIIEGGLRRVPYGGRKHADFEFAKYHLLEDSGQTDAAWDALATANGLMHAHAAADAVREQEGMQRFCEQLEVHSPRMANSRSGGPQPIFIVGLPRSGTTVLERMLANHSHIASAGELTDFSRQLLRLGNVAADYSAAFFAKQLALDFAEVGSRYLAQAGWRAGDRPYFVDKRPPNYVVAGLIHAALPEAKILHLVRDPMDVCFGIWRARFGMTYSWSYDFDALAAQYGLYRRLMRHWHEKYPGAILDVDYAELVQYPQETLRQVLGVCGLEWEPGCDDLGRNTTPVSTLSAAQVREPVHTRALGQWRRYARQLEPLRQRLAGFN